MQRISITNPQNVIDGTAKKYYFKLRNTGGPKGDKGDKGDTGATGPQGPQGNAATVSVGSTTTLPVGYDATVTNTGSIYNAVLDFGIPQGPQGPQGAKGDKGDTGAKGETGAQGPQGERGTNATVYIGTTTTTNPGTQARVYNSGTDSNAVLNFEIPRGDVGPMPTIAQTTGQATDQVMSQKATTDAIANETSSRQNADIGLQSQIDAITSKSDVVDVVATYADLQAYDTQHLGNNDVIKVLDDETHDDALTYYRWSKTNQTWTFIGQEAPYYSKSQTDTLLLGKQDKIDTTHKLSADLVDDTSTTNKFVTASDITNWNGKQDALTAGTGIDITGEVISTPAIVPEVVTELPTTGAEGKLYLTPKAHTTSTATGNPIEATITEQAGQLESFQLDGDTFQQTYTGKNLANPTPVSGGSNGVVATYNSQTGEVTVSGKAQTTWSNPFKVAGSIYLTAGTYTLKQYGELNNGLIACYARGVGHQVDASTLQNTFTTNSDGNAYICITGLTSGNSVSGTIKFQLEAGSAATDFEPFVDVQPSPSPSYPQDINVVTGTQTISINGTNYPISLGSLELCKIGTYKDYIYKDGESWKVHKELGNVTLDSTYYNSRYGTNSYGLTQFLVELGVSDYYDKSGYATMLSNSFTKQTTSFSNTQVQGFLPALDSNSHKLRAWIRISTTTADTIDQFKAWLNTNTPIFYYKLNTATGTTITDQTLIAQLEAIRTANLENGTNTITNTATGTNLAGDMEIGYFGFNPTNRYDKFIWLDLNNNYEQIGGE